MQVPLLLLTFAAVLTMVSPLRAQTLDTLVMGDPASEQSHELHPDFPPLSMGKNYTYPPASEPSDGLPSEVVPGGMGQPARRLLPRAPVSDMYGGELNFTMKVDPVNQNYFTMKLWGSDQNENELILNCENFEIGGRHGRNSEADLFVHHGGAWFPDRFWYRTVALPLRVTKGKQTVAIKIRSAGKIYDYNNKAYTPNYQYLMKGPSWQIYRVYTSVGGYTDTKGEAQGSAEPPPKRTGPGVEVIDKWKADVNNKVNGALKSRGLGMKDIEYLAQCYEVSWTPAFHNAATVKQVVSSIDQVVKQYAAENGKAGGEWGGLYGPVGSAVRLLYPQLKSVLGEKVDFGGNVGPVTRKEGWSKALRASVDSGRTHRRSIGNQEIFCASNIYAANSGLLLIDPANALPEKEALRYPYEAAGLSPFLGDDLPGPGNIPVRGKGMYGPNWFFVTTKGTTKEPGFPGSDYGEMAPLVYRMGRLANDRALMDKGLQMASARGHFRFPGVDPEGFLVMTAAEPVGVRNNFLPGHDTYITRDVSDTGASMAAHEQSPVLDGWFQQQLADGQLYSLVKREGKSGWPDAPHFPDDYAAMMLKPKSGVLMPTAIGAPDHAWGDEENMVVTAKHGEERFFANLAWRSTNAINGMAMVFLVTPQTAVRAEVKLDDVRFVDSGKFETRSDSVDSFDWLNPPDHALYPNAEAGNKYPIAVRPDLVGKVPERNNDGGRGTGYTLCFGHWLVGMNGNYTTGDYPMKLPAGFTSGTDLVSGKVMKAPVVIPKGTTVLFYLPQPAAIVAPVVTKL